jgi:hypothetical protein
VKGEELKSKKAQISEKAVENVATKTKRQNVKTTPAHVVKQKSMERIDPLMEHKRCSGQVQTILKTKA